jgi:histidine triad (HIT) family protein
MKETIFSKIIRKEIPAKIVYEDDELLAFEDVNPQAPVHILIIPKRQIPTLNDIQDDSDILLMGKIVKVAKDLAIKMKFADEGYRLVLNCNEAGGQTVFHIHCHLLGGRQFNWPPG